MAVCTWCAQGDHDGHVYPPRCSGDAFEVGNTTPYACDCTAAPVHCPTCTCTKWHYSLERCLYAKHATRRHLARGGRVL